MQIPMGNFGNAVAAPARASSTLASAVGETLQGIGQGMQREDQQARAQIAQEVRQQQHEAAAQRDAANRAQAQAHLGLGRDRISDAVAEIGAGLEDGSIDKTKAGEEFTRRAKEITAATLEAIPEEHRGIAQIDLDASAQRLQSNVTGLVKKRDQADTRAAINTTLEYAQRLYMTDPGKADALVAGTLNDLGPFSGMPADQVAKAGQAWRERTRFTMAGTLIAGARQSNGALDGVAKRLNSDEFASIDPQQKLQLLNQVEGFKAANTQRAEAEARRRQAAAEHQLHLAQAEFQTASTLVMAGKTLSPEYVDRLTKVTAGTSIAKALPELLRQAPERSAFAMQPLSVMDATIQNERTALAKNGTNPEAEKRLAALVKVRDEAVRDYKDEPLLAAQERGLVQDLPPLDMSNIPALTAGIGQRMQAAALVSRQTGRAVSPLLAQEAERLGSMLGQLPVEQRTTALVSLSKAIGPQQANAMAAQIAPKDPALAIAMGMASPVRPGFSAGQTTQGRYTAELVLRGGDAIKSTVVAKDEKAATGVRAQVLKEIGGAYVNPQLRDAMVEAAVLVHYGLKSEGRDDIKAAIRMATGGIGDWNGKRLPLPYGMSESDFAAKVTAMQPAALEAQLPDGKVYVGRTPVDAGAFVSGIKDAELIHAGQGRYNVRAGGALATNAAGKPVIIEVR